jgi:predicted SnoaL-like aldol condensation-catalyzing enzyme
MARTPEEQRNLDFVLEMYHEVLMPMDSSKVDRYISPDYIQHSSMAPPGREPLKHFLDRIREESPDARQYIKRTFVDGDHVPCTSRGAFSRDPDSQWGHVPHGRQTDPRALGSDHGRAC